MINLLKEKYTAYKKRGFTLIELIVVMAIIAVLVLLAAPKFIGQTDKAKAAQIQNDVKVAEMKVSEALIDGSDVWESWIDHEVSSETLKGFIHKDGTKTSLYGRGGPIYDEDDVEDGGYRVLPRSFIEQEIRSRLEGAFYANKNGTVYYESGVVRQGETAKDRNIQNDVKVAEMKVSEALIDGLDVWESWIGDGVTSDTLKEFIREDGTGTSLYGRGGPIYDKNEVEDGDYRVLPGSFIEQEINSRLEGTFYANQNGTVYYESGVVRQGEADKKEPDQPEGPSKPGQPGDPEEPGSSDEDVNNKEGLMNPIKPRKPIGGEIAIDSAVELAKIGEPEYPLDGKYILTANIDLSGYSEEEGWTPIGNTDSIFTGSFDGNGYKITGLTINRPTTDRVGLFGYTQGATIENVALEDISVTGRHFVGGLVGDAGNSTIENSYATGSVRGSQRVGGLVGSASNITIENSYATGSVKGSGERAGGLVGAAYKSTITNSYSTGSVTGSDQRYVGGLAGSASSSTIESSYATGSVTGGNSVGGLVGYASENATSNSYATGSVTATASNNTRVGGLVGYASGSTIDNSYATGEVNGNHQVGGLVGAAGTLVVYSPRKEINTTIRNSYWNTETTGQDRSSGGGVGKSTEEMKTKDTYSGWDFDTVWKIDEGEYPKLR